MNGTKLLYECLNAQIPRVALGVTTNRGSRTERHQDPEAVVAHDFSIPANLGVHRRATASHGLQLRVGPIFVMGEQREGFGRGCALGNEAQPEDPLSHG